MRAVYAAGGLPAVMLARISAWGVVAYYIVVQQLVTVVRSSNVGESSPVSKQGKSTSTQASDCVNL